MAQCDYYSRRLHQREFLPVVIYQVVLVLWLGPGGEGSVPLPPSTTLNPQNLTWTQYDFPNPHHQPALCGRGDQQDVSWVCDPTGFLSNEQADQLDLLIQGVVNSTGCQCGGKCGSAVGYSGGYKLSLGIVPFLAPSPQGTPVAADGNVQYLGQLFADHLRLYSWRFGSCEDDLVLLYSIRDIRVFNSVGREVRKVLKGSCESEINGEFVSKTREAQYSEALVHMVTELSAVLAGERTCRDNWRVFQWWHILIFSAVIALIIVVTIIITLRIWKNRPDCLRR